MHLKFTHKILLLVFIPLTLLILLQGQRILTSLGLAEELSNIDRYAELATYNSQLVHELQKERGLTSGWLAVAGLAQVTALSLTALPPSVNSRTRPDPPGRPTAMT